MSTELVVPSNHLILCCPLLLPPLIFPSIRIFSNESVFCIRWPKCWSFSFSISPSHEYSGLISFRMDWLDLLAVQGTLKSLLQHCSSKASILRCSAFLWSISHIHTWLLEKGYFSLPFGKTQTLKSFISPFMIQPWVLHCMVSHHSASVLVILISQTPFNFSFYSPFRTFLWGTFPFACGWYPSPVFPELFRSPLALLLLSRIFPACYLVFSPLAHRD